MASPADVLRQLYSGYVGALQGVSDFLRDDLPGASPGVAKWAQEAGRRACRKYARQRGSVPFLTSDPTWDGMCSGYWDSINEGPEEDGSYEKPFTGGQCAKPYGWTVSWEAQPVNPNVMPPQGGTAIQSCAFGGIIGPLKLASRSVPGGHQLAFQVPIQQAVPDGFANIATVTAATHLPPYATSISVNPCPGNPDNCGDPPPEYTPPRFPPNLPSLPTPTNPAPGFGNNWDVDILPDGKVKICIASDCSEGIPPDGGGGPDSGGGPGEPDGDPQESDPNDPDNPNEVSGCVEDGNLLTGLVIEVTESPPNYQGLGDIYYKSCWVWMGPSSALLDMVVDGRTLESGQFVIPDSNDCTCFKVRANPGFRVSVQAYSRPKEE